MTSQHTSKFIAWASAALIATSGSLHAQVNGSILGNATDSTKAAVAGVTVRVTNIDTNQTEQAVTDPVGQYRFLVLPVGRYRLEASLQGFQKFVADNVVLT